MWRQCINAAAKRAVSVNRTPSGDLLEVVTVPGGHTVLWDALDETSGAIARFLAATPSQPT